MQTPCRKRVDRYCLGCWISLNTSVLSMCVHTFYAVCVLCSRYRTGCTSCMASTSATPVRSVVITRIVDPRCSSDTLPYVSFVCFYCSHNCNGCNNVIYCIIKFSSRMLSLLDGSSRRESGLSKMLRNRLSSIIQMHLENGN